MRHQLQCQMPALFLNHSLETRFGDTCLPHLTAKLESGDYDDLLAQVKDLDVMRVDVDWRSTADWILCLVMPDEREACLLYYRDEGPRLNKIYGGTILHKMDLYLCAALDTLLTGMELEDEIRYRGKLRP